MKPGAIQNLLPSTLRGRLVLGVAAVHAVMMTLFIIDVTVRQRGMLLDSRVADATALSQSLSTSAAEWLAADDISGLQELVEAQRRYPELIFAILADERGRILAHTDNSRRGHFLLDLPGDARRTVISKTPVLVDVAAPALIGSRHVGWARVGIGQKAASRKLAEITLYGSLYALAAILIGSAIAWLMGQHITRRLYAVQETISAVRSGQRSARAHLTGSDEAASVAREFNEMLDTLAERDLQLGRSEENFKSLIEDSPVAIAVTDGSDNEVQLLNKKFTWLFGYTIEDIPTLAQWWQLACPEEKYRAEIMGEWAVRVGKAVKTKGSIEPMEAAIACKDGSQRRIEFHMSSIGIRSLTTFIDITERKRAQELLETSEHRLSEAQRIAHVGSWELDLLKNKLSWSDEIYRIFGLTPQEFGATYEAFLDAVHPDDRDYVNTSYTGSLERNVPYDIMHRIVRKSDEEVRHVHERCEHTKDAGGRIIKSIGTVQDITENKLAGDEIRRLNEELEQRIQERTAAIKKKSSELLESQTALMNIVEDLNSKTEQLEGANAAMEKVNRELEAFSYSVSHDLRAPLRAIDGFSLALLEDYGEKLDNEADNYLNRIRSASQRMGQLIDDILSLSRLSRSEMSIRNVDLSSLAESVAEELKQTHPETQVEVIVHKGAFALCDARLLRIALTNLMGNAWKFSSKTPRPRVEFGSVEKDRGKAFFVSDNGVGFDMAYADKLFTPFQRLHPAEEFPGTGIGLATVQRIINRHNGMIWAESETGKGATFYFKLQISAKERRHDN